MSTVVSKLFDGVSRVYDTKAVQALVYRPNQDLVLGELRSAGSRRVLDVGCGTGIMTSRIDGELVVGCDFSDGMLAQAAARSRRPRWVRGDATRLPFDDASFDAVTCTEAFHWFEKSAALAEFHRVLEPGGRVFVALINLRTGVAQDSWPTRRHMRRIVEEAGFEVLRQRRVNRVLGHVLPTVLTVAEKR